MKNRTCLLAWTIVVLTLKAIHSLAQSIYEPYTFTTLAGNVGYGSVDGTGRDARFNAPQGVAVDNTGNAYVADTGNHTIRKVTPAGVVTTLAGLAGIDGSADGTGSDAQFNGPWGVAVDSAGNVYVADRFSHTIRKLTPAGVVSTLAGLAGSVGSADGLGSGARFNYPSDVALDSAGNVYVADVWNHAIRKVTPTGLVTTLAGNPTIRDVNGEPKGGSADGTGSGARFREPSGVAVDSAGIVYVADSGNATIRKVTPTGVVTTLAGLAGTWGSEDGTGGAARFRYPSGVTVDSAGNVYVADSGSTIRKVTPVGEVTTLAGLAGGLGSEDGTGGAARFYWPSGVAVDSAGTVYVADSGNATIRKVTPAGVVTTLADLWGSSVAIDTAGNLYQVFGNSIEKAALVGTNWVVTKLAGLAGSEGSADGTGNDARFHWPSGVAVDGAGNVYVADTGNNTIRKVTRAGAVTTLAGLSHDTNGDGFPDGEYSDGTGSDARFSSPRGVAVDSAGNVYVADTSNDTIRKVTPEGVVTTLAGLAGSEGHSDGTGSDARFSSPRGVAMDSAGNVYVADERSDTIRKVTSAGVVTTLAGGGGSGSADGTGSDVRFGAGPDDVRGVPYGPAGVAVDRAGNVYVADTWNNTIRKGYPSPRILNSGSGFGFNGGQFGFDLTGPAGQLVVIEASTDLINWLPLWTNTFTFPAALNFSDPQSGVSSHRFYRARLP